ncbi:TetR/AcrR family transcriptional regulator [Neobacillus sp. PS3-40]|uniref:TetR/AcrR family transcriptional regulator n=1 Tax=Neobacillus sp. PS3-40 TaxID=3070679 RepID=UPI0027E0E603|nr:TetR/AcrR family transcriptional regulator [Neobacillus sp. PS3-40]WML46334.1 TetR/AcrR family transcriptional regulator [Neobacillus sp. PS3-40]
MFSKFFNLEKEKQVRIVNAAIKEFAQKGYENASTNEMVKEAGISKGLLFHYFQSKKQLYLFLYEYCVDLLVNEVFEKVDMVETDFFARVRQVALVKMELLKKYPQVLKFLESAYIEDANEVKPVIENRQNEFIKVNTKKIFEGIDISRFRDGMDIQKVLKIVIWAFEKMAEEELQKAKLSPTHEIDYERVFLEADEYFEIFTKCFYK